jgi:hypothetical protein
MTRGRLKRQMKLPLETCSCRKYSIVQSCIRTEVSFRDTHEKEFRANLISGEEGVSCSAKGPGNDIDIEIPCLIRHVTRSKTLDTDKPVLIVSHF